MKNKKNKDGGKVKKKAPVGTKIPKKALTIDLTTKGDARNARLTWTESYWRPIILEATQNG